MEVTEAALFAYLLVGVSGCLVGLEDALRCRSGFGAACAITWLAAWPAIVLAIAADTAWWNWRMWRRRRAESKEVR